MKLLRFFLCVLCALCGFSLSAHALDREAFSITRYDLNATVEPEQQRLGVRGTITIRNDSDAAQKNVALQISSSLNWASIRLEGKPTTFVTQTYTSDIDHTGALSEAIVELPRVIAPKQTFDLQIGYEGTIAQDATRLTRIGVPTEVAKHSDWDEIGRDFTAVRGAGNVAWYPIATEAASLSDGDAAPRAIGRWKQREEAAGMRLVITVNDVSPAATPKILCPGSGEAKLQEALGKTSAEMDCTDEATGSAVPFFVIGSYGSFTRPPVQVFYLPQHKSGADDFALALDETAPKVANWFGDHRAKAAAEAEVIDLPDADDAPYESGDVLLMPLSGSDTQYLLAAVRLQTRAAFPSPREWIRDGLAGYAQVALMQDEKNRSAAIAYMQGHRAALIESEKENAAEGDDQAAAHSLINDPDEFYVQAKSMNVWWMLRDMVGEQALTTALHNYKALDDTRADYMEKLIEAQARRDLSWFFDDWVYRDRGLPEFRIVSVFPRQLVNGGFMVTVEVENTGDAAVEVPVTLHMTEGTAGDRLIVPGKSKASVRILTPMRPEEATVNDGSVPEMDAGNNSFTVGP